MPVNTRSGIASLALKKLTSALACAMLLSVSAHAAGLGQLKVLSALGQPLKAEIELTALSNDEAGSLTVKLAPADAFRLANIEFNPALLSLRFAIEQRASRQIIAITSSQPVNEPFVDMLLELNWNSGRMVREYTFLLDPPDLGRNQPMQGTRPVAQATELATEQGDLTGLPPQPPLPAAAPRARPSPAEPVVSTAPRAPERARQSAAPYRVKSGDTLTRIALRNKPADISLDQMLAALYRSNPGAFTGKNMNRLQAGKILAMPDDASMRAESKGQASGVVTAHAADFSAYRNKLAGQVALSAPAKGPEESQSAAGKISAKVEERATPANASKDQLKLSKAEPGATAAGKSAALEDQVAKDQQVADAQARVKELEKNVSDLENLMAAKALQAAGPVSATLPPAAAPVAPKPPVAVIKETNKAAPAAPSLLDMVFDNILYVGLALAALLLALLALIAARRKPAKDAAPTPGAPADDSGQGLDASNNSVFNSTFAASSSQLDTDEVDPVAEADVYIAYGREAQAEEILKEALRTHPERHPVRLKLLEIYAARNDVESFQIQASELHRLSHASGDEWTQAALLGLTIDPLNPLYASAAEVVVAAPAVEVDKSESAAMAAAAAAAAAGLAVLEKKNQLADETPAGPAAPDELDLDERDDAAALRFEPVAKPVDTPTTEARAEPSFDIDFDLPFHPQPETAAEPGMVPEPEPIAPELGIAPGPTVKVEPVPAPATDAGLDFDFDLLPELTPASTPALTPASLPDAPRIPLPATPAAPDPVLDLDLGDADAVQGAVPAPDFDLSGITLDLNRAALEAEPVAVPADAAIEEELSVLAVEMDTKLDLAGAYQEIGDKEGARELIDEVIQGGSKEQAAKARAMLAQLG